jgi:hypothetical protein
MDPETHKQKPTLHEQKLSLRGPVHGHSASSSINYHDDEGCNDAIILPLPPLYHRSGRSQDEMHSRILPIDKGYKKTYYGSHTIPSPTTYKRRNTYLFTG